MPAIITISESDRRLADAQYPVATTTPRPSLAAAVACLLAAQFFFNCVDATGKLLLESNAVLAVLFARNMMHAVAMTAYVGWHYRGLPPAPPRRDLQIWRGVAMFAFVAFFFGALAYLPQAEAAAIVFTTPLVIMVGAGPLLGERVTAARWTAAIVGFAGMLVVIRPGTSLAPLGVAFALAAIACNACFQLLTRRLALAAPPLVTLWWTAMICAIGSVLLLPIAPALRWPDLRETLLALSFGVTGTVCHFFLIGAYRRAPASAIAPFIYVHIVYSVIFGWAVFGQLPDAITLAGIAVIIASGAGIALYERRRAARG